MSFFSSKFFFSSERDREVSVTRDKGKKKHSRTFFFSLLFLSLFPPMPLPRRAEPDGFDRGCLRLLSLLEEEAASKVCV